MCTIVWQRVNNMHELIQTDNNASLQTQASPAAERDFQKEFDSRYITSKEVIEFVGVTRPALFMARNKGYLPGAIVAADGKVIFWDREFIMPHLRLWRASFRRRNGEPLE